MIVIAPLNAPQVYVPPLGGVQHPLAPEVMNAMLRYGSRAVGLWRLINSVASAREPHGRDQRRCLRLRLWGAVRELLKFRVLFRHGPLIATVNFSFRPRPKSPRRLSPSVGALVSQNGGSSPVAAVVKQEPNPRQAPEPKLVVVNQSTPTAAPEPESAAPTPAEISQAARALAQQPRRGRKVTGWLHGRRITRFTPVIVPGGQVLPAYCVRRGFVYALLPDSPEFEDRIFARYRAEQVQIYRSPHAALLGRLPPKPGRKRGRPRTAVVVMPMNTPTVADEGHPARFALCPHNTAQPAEMPS
jgi:hypothetical protein